MAVPEGAPASKGAAVRANLPKRSFASRLFGYDIFLSFALGPPPRGTHSYASDLARRLRERDFNAFFSEDEAPPGEQLDSTLRAALLRSKILVVIANRGVLQEPRWVRKEVEEFRKRHAHRPVITVNVAGALQDPNFAESAQQWLGYQGRIWIDESEETVARGVASERVVERLATVPTRVRSNVKWRWVVWGVSALLLVTSVTAIIEAERAEKNAERALAGENRARIELRRAIFQRLLADAQDIISGVRDEESDRATLYLLAARHIAPEAEVNRILLGAMFQFRKWGAKFSVSGVPVQSAAINPDGGYIVARGVDNSLRRWDARTGMPVGSSFQLQGRQQQFTCVAISADGYRVVTGSRDGSLRLWDARTGRLIGGPMMGHRDMVTSVAFSPDGRYMISGSADETLRTWDARTGESLLTAQGHEGRVTSVAISANGRFVVSASQDHTLRLREITTGRPIGGRMMGHEDMVTSVAFSRDGRYIISGSADKTLRLWDARTGQPIGAPARSRYADVESVVVHPDGHSVVYTSGRRQGRIIRTWDASTGVLLGEFVDIDARSIALQSIGGHIEFAGNDRTLRVSPAPSDWPNELCKKLTHNMSRNQWNEWVSREIDYTCQCPGLPITPDDPETAAPRETCDANSKISTLATR